MVEEYDIKKSLKSVKHLYPVLKDAHGNVIDGFHRLEVDPNWPSNTLEYIKTDVQLELSRFIANAHRRVATREERAESFTKLARALMAEGVESYQMVNVLHDLTTFSKQYIRNLLPTNYKREYEKGPAILTQRVDSSAPVSEKEAEKPSYDYRRETVEEVLSGFRDEDFHVPPRGSRDFIRDRLCTVFGFSDDEAERRINRFRRARPRKQGEPVKRAMPERYVAPQAPTCRCPLCKRVGADKNQILIQIENDSIAQLTLKQFVSGALRK